MLIPEGLSPRYWSQWAQSARSVAQSLESGETWIGGWDSVGLYEGNNKIPEYQTISVHLTTHRLILLPEPPVSGPSTSKSPALQVDLRHVRQTEFYTGFMRSSPKITLSLGQPPGGGGGTDGPTSWTCGVCGFVNSSSPLGGAKCSLCGVAQDTARTISSPASRVATPVPPVPLSASASMSSSKEIACPACTFLNHPSLVNCEICSTALPRRSTSSRPAPPNSIAAPVITDTGGDVEHETVRLSFRKGGVQEAYRRLKNVLSDKAWMRVSSSRPTSPLANGINRAGIDGILQTMSLEAQTQDEHRKSAFKDLEVLMVRAGEMVKMAQSINAKLQSGPMANMEETTLIRSSLVQLGLPAPALTPDMVRDQQRYRIGLAMELGQLLTGMEGRGGLMVGKEGRGVIGLDEVWGLWMRARGVALLAPSTLVEILPFLPDHSDPPINLLILPSSLNVLHTPPFAPPAILSRILARLSPGTSSPTSDSNVEPGAEKSLSVLEIASHENLPIGLTKELMDSIEQVTVPPGMRDPVGLVRDDQAVGDGGVRWYRDIITGWEL